MEAPDGGAAPGKPSMNAFAAVPHDRESITAPPTTRNATVPPAAARPPL